MPDNVTVRSIFDRVKNTFGILRDQYSDTPPDPNEASPATVLPVAAESSGEVKPGSQAGLPPKARPARKLPEVLAQEPIPLGDLHRRYLEGILANNEMVALPGFGGQGGSLQIPFEKLFIPLLLIDKRLGFIRPERDDGFYGGATGLSISSAMQRYRRTLISAGPGTGKTSILRAMQLIYARALLAEKLEDGSKAPLVRQRVMVAEDEHIPVFISLRELGLFLDKKFHRAGQDSLPRLFAFLRTSGRDAAGVAIDLPEDFFEAHFKAGKAMLLLDGWDEIHEPRLLKRVNRLLEKFIKHYPDCRYVVTSRPWGAESAEMLGEQFATLQIKPFNTTEVRQFVRTFATTVESVSAQDSSPETLARAKQRAEALNAAMDSNPRLAEQLVSPMTLVLLALVQRDRERLPDSLADLLQAASQILYDFRIATGLLSMGSEKQTLDLPEVRLTLEMLAFHLQETNTTSLDSVALNDLLSTWFTARYSNDETRAVQATNVMIRVLGGEQLPFGFSWRQIQEWLAGQFLAGREDTLAYISKVIVSPWWHEPILLQTPILNKLAKHRVAELVQFILEKGLKTGLAAHQVAFFAAECLYDMDLKTLDGSLVDDVRKSLRRLVNSQVQSGDRQGLINKANAGRALAILQQGAVQARYWSEPFGEPEWVSIPAGKFWMGESGAEVNQLHQVSLPEFMIARVPVTNAQYAIYLADSGEDAPDHWRGKHPPRGKENHPVVNVNWHEAMAYCNWLSIKINQPVSLPSEAEWEKAARGWKDQRDYPWGAWDELRANTAEFAYGETTPVGLFSTGASPYGLLDMSGNVREWTRSLADFNYPYQPEDSSREDLRAPDDKARVQRGGSFHYTREFAGCAQRQRYLPDFKFLNFGFRVVISSRRV